MQLRSGPGKRKQKHDRLDAELIARLMVEGNFPDLGWVPSLEQRDQRQLLLHRHKLVRMRAQIKNQLQHIAMNQGQQKKRQLWTKAGRELLEKLELEGWTARRRDDLLQLLDTLEGHCASLELAVRQAAEAEPEARRLMTHPGIGPGISLAFVLTIGTVERFAHSRQVGELSRAQPRGELQRRAAAAGGDPEVVRMQGSSSHPVVKVTDRLCEHPASCEGLAQG